METLRPVEVSEYYINRVASGMSKYFWDNIFKEIFDILEDNNTVYNYNPYHDEKGRFCSAEKAITNLVYDIKPVNINLKDIPTFGKRNHKGIRNYVIAAFKHNRNVTIISTGRNVTFTKDGAKRISQKQSPADYEHNAFYTKINEIVERAKLFKFVPADERHKDKVKGQEIYYSRFNIDGEPYRIKIAVDVPLDKYLQIGASYNYAGHRVKRIEIAPARIKVSVDNQHSLAETSATIIIHYDDENFNPTVNNSKDDVINAIRNGSIWYENGAFRTKTRFSNSVATTLESMGAKFSRNAYYIAKSQIPFEYVTVIDFVAAQATAKASQISNFLAGLGSILSKISLKQYIEATVDLMYRKLEVDILKSAQEKKVPVIELGIVQPKVKLPKVQTKNLEKYWKEQDKKAEDLRKAIKEADKKGKDTAELKAALEQTQIDAFQNAPQVEFKLDDLALDEKSKKIAQDYTYNMEFWVKKWEAKNIVIMRQDVLKMIDEGARTERIAEYFEKRWKIAKNKAKFLAENESSLATTAIIVADAQLMGSTMFKWGKSSSKERRPLHLEYAKPTNNKYGIGGKNIFRYDNPPIIEQLKIKKGENVEYIPMPNGQRGLPGQIWNCKCFITPIVPTLDEIINKHKEVRNAKRNIFKRIFNSTQRDNNAWRYRRFG